MPPRRIFILSGSGGEKNLFLIIVSVLGHLKRQLTCPLWPLGGLTSNVFCGRDMDVFWNEPLSNNASKCSLLYYFTLSKARQFYSSRESASMD